MRNPSKKPAASTATWASLLTAHAVLLEKIEARLKQAELPPLGWYDVLWALEKAPQQQLRMHELARQIVLSRSNLTRLTDRLEAAGLVARRQTPDDKRGAYATLTASGLAMRKRMWPTYQSAIDALFNRHIDRKEDALLGAVLRRVLDGNRDD